MSRWSIAIALIALGAWIGTFSAFYLGYDRLPDRVPVHFNAAGEADGWTTRDQLLPFWLIVPGFATFLVVLVFVVPLLAPTLNPGPDVRPKFEFVIFLAALLMSLVQTLVITSSFGVKFDFGRVILTAIFAFFGLVGFSMRGLKRNPVMGIRLPWTLKSDAVWDATHRAASRIYIAAGALGAACAAVGLLSNVPGIIAAVVSLLLFTAVVPIVYSLIVARRLASV
jgi:uncharacterized membrane protein